MQGIGRRIWGAIGEPKWEVAEGIIGKPGIGREIPGGSIWGRGSDCRLAGKLLPKMPSTRPNPWSFTPLGPRGSDPTPSGPTCLWPSSTQGPQLAHC